MALNLSGADKTFRRYAAIEGVNHPPVPKNFEHEVPAGDAIIPNSSNVFTAVAATDLLTTTAHGLAVDTRLHLVNVGGALPGGLSAATDLYVLASGLTANDWKVALTAGGSAINVTDAGTGTHYWQRYLTAPEQAQIDQWFVDHMDASVTLAGAIIMKAAWTAYWNDPKHKAWEIDDYLQRHWQWVWRSADHADAAQPAVPPSANVGGSGSGAPASPANTSPN